VAGLELWRLWLIGSPSSQSILAPQALVIVRPQADASPQQVGPARMGQSGQDSRHGACGCAVRCAVDVDKRLT
jgi:hypothetical protein